MLSLRSSMLEDPLTTFDTLLERLAQPLRIRSPQRDTQTLCMDMKENENEYMAIFNVPGIPKEKVKISIDNQILRVCVDKQEEEETEGANFHWRERTTGEVSRSIRLPDNCNIEGIKAKQCEGVLKVTIPKNKEEEKKKIVNIEE